MNERLRDKIDRLCAEEFVEVESEANYPLLCLITHAAAAYLSYGRGTAPFEARLEELLSRVRENALENKTDIEKGRLP